MQPLAQDGNLALKEASDLHRAENHAAPADIYRGKNTAVVEPRSGILTRGGEKEKGET